MHRLARTGAVLATTAGLFATSGGAAFAHYCYRTDVPESSNMVKGGAWSTKAETTELLLGFLPPACVEAVMAPLPEDTLFMGPGLLAAGAVRNGNAPEGIGHLIEDAQSIPDCAPPAE